MKYSFRVVIGKFIICSSILLLCFIGMIGDAANLLI